MNLFNLFTLFKSPNKSSSRGRTNISPVTLKAIQAEWVSINGMLAGGQPSQLKQALISADKTLDNVLRDITPGTTFAERMNTCRSKFAPHIFSDVWDAHKMRNTLVHESGVEIPGHVLRSSVTKLKSGMEALGVRV